MAAKAAYTAGMQRRSRSQTWSAACVLALACADGHPAVSQTSNLRGLLPGLQLISRDAHAAVIIPNIKRASDALTRLLEGMDRANILLGSRPIDQFKSVTGYTAGVDDNAAAALVVIDAASHPPQWLWLMPVSDADAFLTSSFTGRDGEAYTRSDGTRLFAKALGAHIALALDQSTLQKYQAGEGFAAIVQPAMAGVAHNRFDVCDVLLIARQPLIAALQHRLLDEARQRGAALPGIAVPAKEIADDARTVIIGLEFDPLALILHGLVQFADDSNFGVAVPGERPHDAGLARLPNLPLALAFSANIAALGGATMLNGVAAAMGEPGNAAPAWLQQTNSMQFGIAPSPAGAAGGLLNGAMLALACDDSERLRSAINREMTQPSPANATIHREASYREHVNLPDGVADLWEIRTLEAPPDQAHNHAQALEGMLFGSAGMRGYVRQQPGALLMIFSQRPPLLKTLTDSVMQSTNAADQAAVGLGANPALRTMRRWLPEERDVEAYLNLGLLRQMLVPLLPAMLSADEALPKFEANLPPIGAAIDVERHRASCAMVVPAGVLAPLFDEALQALRLRPAAQVAPPRE
jgi:hypothetical protein